MTDLGDAVWQLSVRGLVHSARWAAEALDGLNEPPKTEFACPALPITTLRAKTYFDCKEFDRCWYALKGATDPVGRFLRNYARFISGERFIEVAPLEKKSTNVNPYLVEIYEEIADVGDDAFLLYLQGVLLARQNQDEQAKTLFIESLQLWPYNWDCWQELLACFNNINDCQRVTASLESDSLMYKIFKLYVKQEFYVYEYEQELKPLIDELHALMPRFQFVDLQHALVCVHSNNYEYAQEVFEGILARDPYRIEELDTYSNLLYVTEQRARLSVLAQKAVKIDKYRAESCCVVANYYGLRGEHELAADYYRRALVSNPRYLSAWTLMGHEYVEMKNTHAAIESYRTAVTISKRDYRAWYGLGQAYEVLDMASYAHYYYQRALALSPGDTRIWSAMGSCYEKMHDIPQAIRTYELGLSISKNDAYFYFRLANLYKDINPQKAIENFELCAVQEDDGNDSFKLQARMWLARHAASLGKWLEARDHAAAVVESEFSSGFEEEARTIIRDALHEINN